MSQKVRVGVISTSGFAEWNLIPNTQSHQNAELLSVCGRRLDRATEVAKKHGINKIYTDYRERIRSDDLDAVIVGSCQLSERQASLKAVCSIATSKVRYVSHNSEWFIWFNATCFEPNCFLS